MTYFFAVSNLRAMSPMEVHNLYKLRVDIFVHEQRCPYAEIDTTDALDTTSHVQAFDTDRVLRGTARVYTTTAAEFAAEAHLPAPADSTAPVAHIGRLCVDKDARHAGLGSEIMRQTIRLAEEQYPGMPVVITAQEHLVDYYATFGFVPAGNTFDWDGVNHVPMQLEKN
ncbi:GNAT family N-acetyltransferase [Corynebacterium aquilae]|uniref:N-acetyltransferase domain-containing protein n=1 Tax=Corynebacterium aquilae DSM 44791 TaxID=1431546 RepID=A0A1L7CI51_9CORY|nr:GNAT family N-acetyltransferase [Corynebacterium aquilae]APT85537.1 hypothetical protein CAQU_11305 [Corynebacterium aquilae DSM 44791]